MPIDAGRRSALPYRAVASLLLAIGCRGTGVPVPGGPSPARLTDERIAGIALLVNNIELGYSVLGVERAVDRDVRAYALRMRTDHASLNATLASIIERLGIVARDDFHGDALRDSAVVRRERLQSAGARGFDVAFVDAELRSHRELLGVARALRTDARHPALRDYLEALGPVLAAHVAHAEQLGSALSARGR